MKPERWQQIDELFHAALAHEGEERAAFLDEGCAGDEELRREVESLIAAHEQEGSFIDSPAFVVTPEPTGEDQVQSMVGQQVGRYEVLSLLGRGGMGEVFLARDARLGRLVALKLIAPSLALDTDRLGRFEREARAASALNHPNVCTIYEVGKTEDGRHYITMEYVEGVSLRERMIGRGTKLAEVLDLGAQIASALSAAHEAGVIHRDIKPENILLRHDRLVKVLDFGLAKLIEQQQPSDSEAPTRARVMTRTGMVMGTVSYMSPEQARGFKVDARTDIWSLGVMLYEMVTGRTPFEGETNSDLIVSILEREPPPLVRFARDVPPELERIITKTLRKEVDERYQTVKDLGLDLRSLKEEMEFAARHERSAPPERSTEGVISNGSAPAASVITRTEAAPVSTNQSVRTSEGSPSTADPLKASRRGSLSRRSRGRRILLLATVTTLSLAAGVALLLYRLAVQDRTPGRARTPSQVTPVTSFPGYERQPAFSPDGNQVAFVWDGEREDNQDIYVKLINAGEPLRLTTNPAPDLNPVWSPDARHIAFTRAGAGGGIYLVPALGGPERRLAEIFPERPFHKGSLSYSPGGEWLAIADKDSAAEPFSIFLLSVETGEKRRLTSPPAGSVGDEAPAFSPDGKTVAFARMLAVGMKEIYVVPASSGEPKRLTFDNTMTIGLTWTVEGREIVFSSRRGGSIDHLWRVPASGGDPERVAVFAHEVFDPVISRQGSRLAWTQLQEDRNIWKAELTGTPAQAGAPVKVIASTMFEGNPQFSPDGEKIAFVSSRSGALEIWVSDADGKNPLQLTTMGVTGTPRWSPDGRWIAFDRLLEGNRDVYVVSSQGGNPRRLTEEPSEDMCPSWSGDGRFVYFGSGRSGSLQIWKMPAAGGGEAVQVTRQGGFEGFEDPEGEYFYYAKGRQEPGIWRVPVGGGVEQFVLDHHRAGYWRYWAVTRRGIYFVTAETPSRPEVEFFSFATKEVRQVATLERPILIGIWGFSVSADERWMLFTQLDQRGSDIMLMEDFR